VKGGDRERKAILEEVQRILEMVLSRVKLGSAGERKWGGRRQARRL
jgi:hypothetical protein